MVSDPDRSEVYSLKIPGLGSHSLLERMRCPQAHYNGRTLEVGTVMMLGQSSELPSRAESTCADLACDPVFQPYALLQISSDRVAGARQRPRTERKATFALVCNC